MSKEPIKVPGEFVDIVKDLYDMHGGRLKHFIRKFLSNFDDPESWFEGFRDKTTDEPVIKFSLNRYYHRVYKWRYDRNRKR